MTEKERQQEKEIERLQKKVKMLSEAYEKVSQELKQVKQEPKRKGRPAVDGMTKAKVLELYRQEHTMREIAKQEGIAASTVHKIIAKASKESRIVYVYANRENPATIIDACALTQKVKIENLTDDMLSRAFGVRENPDWEDYEEFLESRCMPRTRFGIREELNYMGLDSYDPFLILRETSGRVYGDHQYLRRMEKNWIDAYDKILKEIGSDSGKMEKLLEFMRRSEKEWKLNEGEY